MKNKITDLRNSLFETMEMIKNKEIEPDAARAVVEVAKVIVDSAKAETDFLKAIGSTGTGSGFIPEEVRQLG